MAREKEEIDDDCYDCQYFHSLPERISGDAYYDHPEENECDKEWECPYLEDDDTEDDEC
jgi:hypothetical protein